MKGKDELQWYKDAIIYELRVRSFYDSDGDGVGDFRGLTEKLDYLEDLGVNTIWLLPFYPSPLLDDGYDIAEYTDVHPDCGTLSDFKLFLREAHERGLRVVTELVLNHTSDRHPWFQRARRSPPGSRYREYYVWSESAEKYREARIIFQDFEPSNWTWDPLAKAHYWHRFYAHQPDLNFAHPDVRRAMLRVVDFWLRLGVDGLRLDAVPYLYEREATSCENLPETHSFLRELRRHVDRRFKGRMLLAEANQWPEDAAAYFGQGDECHMAFHFPLMPRMYLAVRTEDQFPITDIWAQTPRIPESCQWALFLRNHDELTLEMVTDEERDYMYRAYAREARMRINLGIRRRLAPLFGNNRRAIELMNGLLLSLPGTPVIYYGDEIGMGDNIYLGDRDGVRTPMQWSADRNAGFSRANPQKLILPLILDHEYHYEAVNVESQQNNLHSLLWWMKRIIALRKRHRALGRGDIEFIDPDNPKVIAFIRRCDLEQVLVVANLSRFVQLVRLDLSRRQGLVPVELFGSTRFPPISDHPYFFTLGPHGFYWFALEDPQPDVTSVLEEPPPVVSFQSLGERLLGTRERAEMSRLLPAYLASRRWFTGRGRSVKGAELVNALPVEGPPEASLAMCQVEYHDGEPETYLLSVGAATGAEAAELRARAPASVLAETLPLEAVTPSEERGVVFNALTDPRFCRRLLELFDRRRRLTSRAGEIVAVSTPAYSALRGSEAHLAPRVMAEESNTSLGFGDRLVLKLFRRLEHGPSAELEVLRFLAGHSSFRNVPALAGWLEYRARRNEPMTVGVLQALVPNQGDGWRYTAEELKRFYEGVLAGQLPPAPASGEHVLDLLDEAPPSGVTELLGAYLEAVRLMGRRTGELHLALSSGQPDTGFDPEPFSALDQRSTYQSMRNMTNAVFRQLRRNLSSLPGPARAMASRVLESEGTVSSRFERFLRLKITVPRIRCHGDYRLEQILYTGRDFVIIDFEGEAARPLAERRRKRTCLRDVVGMLRSFHRAAWGVLQELIESGGLGGRHKQELEPYADLWQLWSGWGFLKGYLDTLGHSEIVPAGRDELRTLLDVLLLRKALYELGQELTRRSDWVAIPLRAIADLCRQI